MKNLERKLSVIIVNYKSGKNLDNCLASFWNHPGFKKAQVVIVNNDPDDSLENIRVKYEQAKIISPGENLGFGRANNLGARCAEGEVLFFLNPDARIKKGKIKEILDKFESDEKLGVMGSRLLEKNGKIQPFSSGREVTFWGIILNNLGFLPDKKIWKSSQEREVFWVSATAFFVRKIFFEELGGFDEKIFMYFEDIDLCARAKNFGYRTLYFPRFCVTHLGGQSYFDKKSQKKDYYASQKYYFKKNRPGWESAAINLLGKISRK